MVELVRLGQAALAHRAGLPGTERRPRSGPLRGPLLAGWHHHATLVGVAHGFLTLERLRRPNRGGVGLSLWQLLERVEAPARLLGRRLPALPPSRAPLAPSPRTSPRTNLTEPY